MTLQELNSLLPQNLKHCVCLNTSQVSKIIGVSPSTLERWRKDGISLDYIKIENGSKSRVLYSKYSILDFLNKTVKTA